MASLGSAWSKLIKTMTSDRPSAKKVYHEHLAKTACLLTLYSVLHIIRLHCIIMHCIIMHCHHHALSCTVTLLAHAIRHCRADGHEDNIISLDVVSPFLLPGLGLVEVDQDYDR